MIKEGKYGQGSGWSGGKQLPSITNSDSLGSLTVLAVDKEAPHCLTTIHWRSESLTFPAWNVSVLSSTCGRVECARYYFSASEHYNSKYSTGLKVGPMSIPGKRDMVRISKKFVMYVDGVRQSAAEYKIGREPLKCSISEIHSFETSCTVTLYYSVQL